MSNLSLNPSFGTVRPGIAPHTGSGFPALFGVGTAFPDRRYTQDEIKRLLGIDHATVQKLLKSPHIQTRHLYLPPPPVPDSAIEEESHEQLIAKFEKGVREIGVSAVRTAIRDVFVPSDIEFLVCVTSTGFSVPGLSSIIARELNLSHRLFRLDVVGMGCNGGMTAMRSAAALAADGAIGVLLCCEINSAMYVRDGNLRTGIVNSLFGDGAAAAALGPYNRNLPQTGRAVPTILDFETYSIPEYWDAMRFEWNEEFKKWSFGLSKEIPFVVGANLKVPVSNLLERNSVSLDEIRHWTIHTGGGAVIDGVKKSLGISEDQVRHTRSVLRDYGNISSGSFLVSLSRLLEESKIQDGDMGVWAAMGPGTTLETCLVRYSIEEE